VLGDPSATGWSPHILVTAASTYFYSPFYAFGHRETRAKAFSHFSLDPVRVLCSPCCTHGCDGLATALWQSGTLHIMTACQQVVFSMRAAMDTLLLRLTAVEAMVMQKPIITGRYTGSPWMNLAQPLSDLINQQMEALVALGQAVRWSAALLG